MSSSDRPLPGTEVDAWWRDNAPDEFREQATPFFLSALELEHQGRYDEAFAAFVEGNSIKHGPLNAEILIATHCTQGIRHLKEVFTPASSPSTRRRIPSSRRSSSSACPDPARVWWSRYSPRTLGCRAWARARRCRTYWPTPIRSIWPAGSTRRRWPANIWPRSAPRDGARSPRFTDKLLMNYTADRPDPSAVSAGRHPAHGARSRRHPPLLLSRPFSSRRPHALRPTT